MVYVRRSIFRDRLQPTRTRPSPEGIWWDDTQARTVWFMLTWSEGEHQKRSRSSDATSAGIGSSEHYGVWSCGRLQNSLARFRLWRSWQAAQEVRKARS